MTPLVVEIPPDATILDVRWQLGGPPGWPQYLEGHIPGAVFVDLETALAAPPGEGGRHPLPSALAFGSAMRAAGVSGNRPVVVYDAGDSMAAARAWWLLRYFGHSRAFVLDGGFSGWLAAGHAIERTVPSIEEGDFVPRAGGMALLDAAGAARVAVCCSTRGRASGSGVSASRSTRWRGTFLGRSVCRAPNFLTWETPQGSAPGSRRPGFGTVWRSVLTAGRGSRLRSRCWR